jgi:hypothetical protein
MFELKSMIKFNFTSKPFEWISILIFIVYISPLILNTNDARFLVHDNLDGMIPLYSFMGNTDVFFANSNEMIRGIMDQMPRSFLPSKFSFFRFLFLFLSPLKAYIIHFIFLHLVAFIGLRIFIKDYIAKDNPMVYNFAALAFSLLPFWPSGELTVAGLPLLTWSLLKIFKNQGQGSMWLIILLFPFFSSLPFGNMFSFPILFLIYLLGCTVLKYWKFKWIHLLPFLILGLITIISEWDMFMLIFSGIKSNRIENLGEAMHMNLKGIIGVSVLAFLFGHYHFHSFQFFIIFIIFAFFIFSFYRKDKQTYHTILVSITILFCLYFTTIFLNNVVLLKDFQFSIRFWVLFPALWYILFAFVLSKINNKYLRNTLGSIQIIWVMFLIYPKDYYGSVYAENPFYYSIVNRNSEDQSSFNDYYNVDEFSQIKKYFPELSNANIMCVGFCPGIAWYNKMNTFDAYLNLYPIEKWHTIKKINEDEFEKGGIKYYSNNRAYLFSSEINLKKDTLNPKWNLNGFKEARVDYLLSNKPIKGAYQLIGKTRNIYIYLINI